MKTALTIAGSDSGGGAGIQADLRTFAAHGVHGLSAITAVTAQNTTGCTMVHPVPPEAVVAQIETVAADIGIDAVKTGMLSGVAVVEAVAASLARLRLPVVVVDPVLRASTGRALLAGDALEALQRRLLPLAYCVTPNLEEAARLSGVTIHNATDAREAARRIAELGPRTVVITGGHASTDGIVDLLFDRGRFVELRHARVRASTTHGTGCTYSAALAAGLARARPLEDAARAAAAFVAESIRRGVPLGAGAGPVRANLSGSARGAAAILEKVSGPRFLVTQDALSVDDVLAAVGEGATARPTAGAVTAFLGQVRGTNLGKTVLHLEYEGYEPLAVKAFERIADESKRCWPEVDVAIHHRLGRLGVGETSVAIAAASPHRGEAFAACRYSIERIKQIAPIWKHEFFEGGDVWIEGATADPDDEGAREDAYRRACA